MVHLLLEELLKLSGTIALSLHLRPESLRLSSYLHAHTCKPQVHASDRHIPTYLPRTDMSDICNKRASVPKAAGSACLYTS